MKKSILRLMVLVIFATSLQGCYGKFALTRKLYALNGEINEKHLRSAFTWVLIFPCGILGLVDFAVFNTIEFWSGNNPLAEGEKDFRYANGADRYDIHARKSGDKVTYDITHYNFDNYVDALHIDWNITQDTAQSKYSSGNGVAENFAVRDANGGQVLVRTMGYLSNTVTLASR